MKKDDGKIEVIWNQRRYFLSEKAAEIAVESLGAIKPVPYERPKELLLKTIQPPKITDQPKELIKPPELIKKEEPKKEVKATVRRKKNVK